MMCSIEDIEGYFELDGYGVKLKRLTHEKIELLRQWRNDPKIQQYMFYRQEITPEMQERWFANLDKKSNFYFIIEYQGKEVGCVNIKDVDYEKKCGEPGIFLYDEGCLNSDVAIRASLLMREFVWNVLQLESQYIHVVRSNIRAVKYNKMLGYKLIPGYEECESQMYQITREDSQKPNKFLDRIKSVLSKNYQ